MRPPALRLSPELELLLACATAAPSPEAQARIETLAAQPLNHPRLLHLAALHGTRPLLHKHFSQHLPEPYHSQLAAECRAIAARNLFLTGELLRILDLLQNHNIPATVLKGPALALQLHNDVTLREFSDLDILVPKSQAWSAADLLIRLGYTPNFAPPDYRRALFLDYDCEILLAHPSGLTVEIHWDFAPSFFPFPLNTTRIRTTQVHLAGRPIPTLSLPDAFFFACGHAVKHARLSARWTGEIASLAALLSELPVPTHSPRMVRLALDLAATLHHIPNHVPDPSLQTHLALCDNLKDRLRLLSIPFTPSAEDWQSYSVPRPLSFLYWLTMPLRRLRKLLLGNPTTTESP